MIEEGRKNWERLHCHGTEREEVGLRISGYGFFVATLSQIDIRSPTWAFFSCCTFYQNSGKYTSIAGSSSALASS